MGALSGFSSKGDETRDYIGYIYPREYRNTCPPGGLYSSRYELSEGLKEFDKVIWMEHGVIKKDFIS